jgi:EAL domain-containing protein (putative c-di-GMP-specific phosphodiesterase class I)
LCGFEALMRWEHPTRGLLGPGLFIPLAEELGLIVPLGRWALQVACIEAMGWPDDVRVAVNLSAVQFGSRELVRWVAEALGVSGLEPRRLNLEITESVLLQNTEEVLGILHELRGLGPSISMDDFGTGYSSLSYLRRFPFDKIKIDQSFVKGLGEDDEARAIVQAIVALGRSLRLSVTAEGVETEGQLAQLRLLRCNQVQGFLLGRPMEQHHLPALFRNG